MKPSDLIDIVDRYCTDAGGIITHPASYLSALNLDDRALFIRGATYFVLSVGVVFLLAVPVFWKHGRTISPEMHQFFGLFLLLVLGVVYHISFKLLGGSGTLRQTLGAYGFVAGTLAPVHAVLMYPSALKFGPEFVLLTSAPAIQAATKNIDPSVSNVTFLASNMMVTGLVEPIVGLLIAVPTFAAVHRMGYWRSFVSLLVPLVLVFFFLIGVAS